MGWGGVTAVQSFTHMSKWQEGKCNGKGWGVQGWKGGQSGTHVPPNSQGPVSAPAPSTHLTPATLELVEPPATSHPPPVLLCPPPQHLPEDGALEVAPLNRSTACHGNPSFLLQVSKPQTPGPPRPPWGNNSLLGP